MRNFPFSGHGKTKPIQSQLSSALVTAERAGAGQGWGLKVNNDGNYPLRCLKSAKGG